MGGVPVYDSASAGEGFAYEGLVIHIHPVVVEHVYPEQREGGNELRQARGIAALGDSFRDDGGFNIIDGLTREAAVSGVGVGDEGLDAGVAYVLKLLPIGGVHVGFMRAEAGGAPAGVPQFFEIGDVAVYAGLLLKRVGVEPAAKAFKAQRLVFSGHIYLQITPCTPPERLVGAVITAIADELV